MRFSLDIVALGETLGRLGLRPTGFAFIKTIAHPAFLGSGLGSVNPGPNDE
jgi:hypothetical protein